MLLLTMPKDEHGKQIFSTLFESLIQYDMQKSGCQMAMKMSI